MGYTVINASLYTSTIHRCRGIHVVCMLLLSGLQKEDLDAGTLQKLRRHNVNMEDMNNEKLRQECLLESYSLKGNNVENNTTNVQAQTTEAFTITSKRSEKDDNFDELPRMRARIADKTVLYNDHNMNKTKAILDPHNNVTTKMLPISIGPPIIVFHDLANAQKDDENKDLQNQPDIESIMNFWTKLTQHTKTLVTRQPTTTKAMPTIRRERNVTTTVHIVSPQGQVDSRNMALISSLLAHYYLATRPTPNTTSQTTTEEYKNYMPKKHAEKPNQYGIIDEQSRLNPTINDDENNQVTQGDLQANKDVVSSISEETKSILFKHNKPESKEVKDTPYNLILNEPKIRFLSTSNYSGPIKFLNGLLQNHNVNKNGEPVSDTGTTAKIKRSKPETSETFHHYHLVQHMNGVNNTANEMKHTQSLYVHNMDRPKRVGSAEVKSWQPWEDKQKPRKIFTEEEDPNQNLPSNINQFNAALPEFDNVKRLNILRAHKPLDGTVNKSGKTNNFDSFSHRVKIRPGHMMKRTKLNKTFKGENNRFKTLLPSIKNAKKNQFAKRMNNPNFSPEELSKSEQNDNNVFIPLEDTKVIVVQNHLPKTNYIQFNEEAKSIRNITPHRIELSDGNQNENMTPAVKVSEIIDEDTGQEIRSIPERYKFQQHKERRTPENVLTPTKSFGSKVLEPEAIPANVLKEIAEKVKQIVLKDIETKVTTLPPVPREAPIVMSTTLAPTMVTTTTVTSTTPSTTPAPTTVTTPSTTTTIITTSEQPSTLQKEITVANQDIKQVIMDIFKELKAMKPADMFTSQAPPNTPVSVATTVRTTTKLPVILQKNQRDAFNPYTMKGHNIQTINVNPYLNGAMPVQNPGAPYQFPVKQINDALTIQTNDDEIAPLAIQMPQPLKAINQHIVVTTKPNPRKEQLERESKKRIDEGLGLEDRNQRDKVLTDFLKKERFGVMPLKRQDFRDFSYKSRIIKDKEKQWHNREYNEKLRHFENHAMSPRHRDAIHYQGGISNLENLDRQRGLSNSASLSYTGSINRPGLTHYHKMPRIKPGTFSHSDYDREPRYDTRDTKFHKKLEKIENWPRHSWKEFNTLPTDTSNDEISKRQQMPMVKPRIPMVKPRNRYDDTHFRNFLQSQQKVTDMLEKILANKMKSRDPSVEVS
nr:uncharacterized protein LOC110376449 isoform X1 [Helicoverpa armigera]